MADRWAVALRGLRQDSLAAVLALIGLLKALEESAPSWKPEAKWERGGAILLVPEGKSGGEVCDAAASGAAALGKKMQIGMKKINGIDPSKLPRMLSRTDADVVASMVSDGALTKDGTMRPGALCLTLGAGQQFFGRDFDTAVGMREEGIADALRRGLLETWDRPEKRQQGAPGIRPFRLDWRERRMHALRAEDPVGFKAPVTGAEPLIALGLSEFASAPERGGLGTTGCGSRGGAVAWPIWGRPLPLDAVRILLGMGELRQIADAQHPPRPLGRARGGASADVDAGVRTGRIAKLVAAMRGYGAQDVIVARIITDGKFRTVGVGTPAGHGLGA